MDADLYPATPSSPACLWLSEVGLLFQDDSQEVGSSKFSGVRRPPVGFVPLVDVAVPFGGVVTLAMSQRESRRVLSGRSQSCSSNTPPSTSRRTSSADAPDRILLSTSWACTSDMDRIARKKPFRQSFWRSSSVNFLFIEALRDSEGSAVYRQSNPRLMH